MTEPGCWESHALLVRLIGGHSISHSRRTSKVFAVQLVIKKQETKIDGNPFGNRFKILGKCLVGTAVSHV